MENFFGCGAMCVPVVVYGNRAFEDALKELYDCLKDRGFKAVAAAAFVGEHSYGREIATGRPDEADLMTARQFGSAIGEKIFKIQDDRTMEGVKVPGNYPYKERRASDAWCPQTTDACVKCGRCTQVCPVGIIPKDHPEIITKPEECQHCCACVKSCPTKAKIMTSDFYKNIRQRLIENCTVKQNQPELFL